MTVKTAKNTEGGVSDSADLFVFLITPLSTLFMGVVDLIWAIVLGMLRVSLVRAESGGAYLYFGIGLAITAILLLIVFLALWYYGTEMIASLGELLVVAGLVFVSLVVTSTASFLAFTADPIPAGVAFVPFANVCLFGLCLARIGAGSK